MTKKFLMAIFVLGVSVAATSAQIGPEQAILSARERFSDIKNRSMELERMKRESYKRPVDNNVSFDFLSIKKDFEEIQKLNSAVFKLTVAKTTLNLSAVSKFVAKINHRAVRLKSNLFPVAAKHEKNTENSQSESTRTKEVIMLLTDLDKFVNRFVHSPIFQNLNIVNTADSLKAEKDLEKVISISHAIKSHRKN